MPEPSTPSLGFAAALAHHRPAASHWRVVEFGERVWSEPYLAAGCRVVGLVSGAHLADGLRENFPGFHVVRVGTIDAPDDVVLRTDDADLVIVDRWPDERGWAAIARWLAPGGIVAVHGDGDAPGLHPLCSGPGFALFGDRRPPEQLPRELDLDRTACVDRAAIRRLMLCPSWTPVVDPSADLPILLRAVERAVERDALDVRALPWPPLGPPSAAAPRCDTLAILPHPDDETVYAGGILHGWVAAGERVHLVVATDGAGGRGGSDLGIVRARELLHAAAVLGLRHLQTLAWADFGKYRDGTRTEPVTAADTLRAWNWPIALRQLVEVVRRHRPTRLLSLDAEVDPNYSLHGHHLGLGTLVALAFHAAASPAFAPEVGPPWACDEHLVLAPDDRPALTFAIDRRSKIAALRAHASQRYSTARLLAALGDASRPAMESIRRLQARRILPLRIVLSSGERPEPEPAWRPPTVERPRAALVELLRRQAEARPPDASVDAAIARLADPRSVAVVTGQQVGLFGGPALTLVKACAAIALARRIRAAGIEAVPVFWLASYDHDVDEVATVPRLEHPALRLRGLARDCPVGTQRLGPDIERVLEAFLDPSHPPGLADLLRACYRPQATLAAAFAEFLARVLTGLGLVILDPADPTFARLASGVFRRELLGPRADEPLARSRARRATEGLAEIVPTERDRLQLFFEDSTGRRRRLRATATGLAFEGGTLEPAEVERLLAEAPERFTPAALLRPIVQDAVLPSIAYVAGPTEARYLDQARELYAWADVPRSTVIARPSVLPVSTGDISTLLPELDPLALLDHERPFEALARAAMSNELRTWLEAIEATIDALVEARSRCRTAEPFDRHRCAEAFERAVVAGRRSSSALPRAGARWQTRLAPMHDLVAELPSVSPKNRVASTRPFTRLLRELTGLRRAMLRDVRRLRPHAVAAFGRLASRPAPPERRQTTAECLARAGLCLPATLVAAMERDFAARYVVQSGADPGPSKAATAAPGGPIPL